MPRTRELEKIKSKLRKNHFVALTGPAFCGKSWLCRELQNQLQEEFKAGKVISDKFRGRAGMKWKIAFLTMDHGRTPMQQLAKVLAHPEEAILVPPTEKVSPLFEREVLTTLNRPEHRGLLDLYEETSYLKDYNLLIIVDQFEHLFSATKFRAEVKSQDQKDFLRTLLKASFEEQQIYLAVAIRPPKSERWKYQFKELWDAMETGEFPVYALDQEGLEKAIWSAYEENSIAFQERIHQQRQGVVPPNLRPFSLDPSKHQAWVEQLYFHEDPLTEMETLVSTNIVADWKQKGEKALVTPAARDSMDESRFYSDPMVQLDDEGFGDGPVEESYVAGSGGGPGAPAPLVHEAEVNSAEELYAWLTPLEKRVTGKIFQELLQEDGGPVEYGTIAQNIGRFQQMVHQVVSRFIENKIFTSSTGDDLSPGSEISIKEPALMVEWDRAVQWAKEIGVTASASAGRSSSRSAGGSGQSWSSSSRKSSGAPSRHSAGAPSRQSTSSSRGSSSAGGGDVGVGKQAEVVYGSLTPIQKRISEKLFINLAKSAGVATFGDIVDAMGRFESLLGGVAEPFVKAGVLRAEGRGMNASTVFRLPDGIGEDWERMAKWLDYHGIAAPATSRPASGAAEEPADQPSDRESGGSVPPPRTRQKTRPVMKEPEPEKKSRSAPKSRPEKPEKSRSAPSGRSAKSSRGGASSASSELESAYSSLTPLEKRVTQKMFLILAANGGSVSLREMVDEVGRFEGIVKNLIQEWIRHGAFAPGGDPVAFRDAGIPDSWGRIKEWKKQSGAA